MLISSGAIDDLALVIPHLDLRAGKRLFPRDVLLGERDGCVDQFIMYGFGQTDTNDIGIQSISEPPSRLLSAPQSC